ncbi:MAG: ATP-binding protein [Planctomycetaceae bacterium]
MPRARIPADEMQRLNSLYDCCILDSLPENGFDDLTALAARLCDTPIALVSLVDAERQWFMSAVGTEAKETHRDSAFCAHAILGDEPLIVRDAATDPRTFDNALVLGPPYIRFYAGIPLRTGDGHALGTLCVIDTVPRDITSQQLEDLKSLARQAASQLELRRLNRILVQSQSQQKELHTRLNEIARRTEESLRFDRERLDLALAGGEIGTWDWNIQTGEEIWDAGLADLLGERLEDLNQSFNEFTARVHPHDLTEVMSNAQKHLDGLTPIYAAEFRIRQKNGDWRWVQAHGRLMQRDQNGRPLRMLGTMADISDRKRTEEELVNARVMADTANRSKSEFLANMSHEIRTPLTSILGYADLLSVPGLSVVETADNIAIIKSAGSHLMTIINDVLDLSKIEAGKMTVECIETFPSRVIHEVLSALQPAAEAKGLQLNAQCLGPIPGRISSDPVRVRQILINLIGNAVKFTEKGHVRVTAQMVPESPDGIERLAFEVTDTGIGMTPEECKSLFEPFTQADPSMTRRFGGTGLGLAICRRMAQILDGEIVATSQPGIGSTFRVTIATGSLQHVELFDTLSSADEASDRSAFALHHLKRSLQGRILLADDNPVNRRLFEAILRNAGAAVDVAENGQVAVEKAVTAMMPSSSPGDMARSRTLPGYDLILMDMQMPVLDGYSATKHLRAIRYQGPIVALTAHALMEDREKCLAVGCDDVISKPVERDLLIHTCHEWIERARSNRCRLSGIDKSAGTMTAPDSAGVDMKALMDSVNGDMGRRPDCLFMSNSADLICEMQQAIEARDCAAIGPVAHSLKGAVSTFSARNALHAATTVETLARDADLDGAAEAFDRLRSEVDELIHELAELRSGEAKLAVASNSP